MGSTRIGWGHLGIGMAALAAGVACGGAVNNTGGPGTSAVSTGRPICSTEQPACPTPPPSYTNDIARIISRSCLQCHGTGGVGAAVGGDATADPNSQDAHNWSRHENLYRARVDVMQQVFLCNMPPSIAPPLPPADRALLLDWLVCGAPNN
jgi:hypothetical protein